MFYICLNSIAFDIIKIMWQPSLCVGGLEDRACLGFSLADCAFVCDAAGIARHGLPPCSYMHGYIQEMKDDKNGAV